MARFSPARPLHSNPTNSPAERILAIFDRNVTGAERVHATLPVDRLPSPWRNRRGGKLVFELPRFVVLRITALNYLVHHRGQLSVCLSLLDVPLPLICGPTAVES